ncbi:MAG: MBOAT family protein, partial [Lachnospiraceae bacterium]|nr:MBOAT family protein [Lachnospiraceae bacterium]
MNFISLEYLLISPIVCILFYSIPQKYRWVLLLCSSYFFYLYWNQWSVMLLFGMTMLTFWTGRKITKSNGKGWVILSVIICVGSIVVSRAINMPPVGISFYAFQTLSYVIDVYRG